MATARNPGMWWAILLAITIFSLSFPVYAKYSGGTGEPNDPYQIATADDLMLLGDSPEDYDKHFILTAGIDLDPNLPGRKIFDKAVIASDPNLEDGFQGNAFMGVFDGGGHTISHLTITGASYLGLFGQSGYYGAMIFNLELEAVDVHGTGAYVGGLVGRNGGSISNCYSSGEISGNYSIGGLVGSNEASIATSYSAGTVWGDGHVGGLVGKNGGSIANSYSTSAVSGDIHVGGFVGKNDRGSITTSYSIGTVTGNNHVGGLVGVTSFDGGIAASFWDIESSGQTPRGVSTGLTTAEMQDISTFLGAGWDFVDENRNGTCDYWQISPGDYPRLRYHAGDSPVMPEGLGTAEEPYLIRDTRDLGTVWFEPLAHYRLEASVDLSGISWSMAPIPWFGGNFDGNSYVISNLHIQGGGYLGLFGQSGSGAKISNLGMEGVVVNGTGNCVGGLAGSSYNSSFASSYSSGTVCGIRFVGGLVGTSYKGAITDCYSTGTVSGRYEIGGLVGSTYDGNIARSYSTATVCGTISGNDSIAGLVGVNSGSLTTSYATGTVCGHSSVGGLVGVNYGSITSSYTTGTVCGEAGVGGLAGDSYGNITMSYSIGMVYGDFSVGGAVGENYDGEIATSYSTAMVCGVDNVGGLVGRNNRWASVTNSYANSMVTGRSYVGGLLGLNEGHVANSYSTGTVSGILAAGGLVGKNGAPVRDSSRLVTSSFWDVEASRFLSSDGGIGKTTSQMQTARTFLGAGWDFVGETANGTGDIWWILEGKDYPRLWWEADNN